MKNIIFILLFIPFTASAQQSEEVFLADFIRGTYQLIGKYPDTTKTYFGRIEIFNSDDDIHVSRTINNIKTHGTGTIEQTTADKINVLRIRFEENSIEYEETCLIDSDLDNYARLTCHLYRPGVRTANPGIEALFIDHDPR